MKKTLALLRAACLSGALLLTTAARAATVTWTGLGADDNLSTGGNWDTGLAPTLSDAAVFTGFTRTNPAANVATNFFTITADASAGPFTINGPGAITTGTTAPAGGGVTNLSPYTLVFANAFNPRCGAIVPSGADILLRGSFNVGNGGTTAGRHITNDGPRNLIVNTPLSGAGTDTSAGGHLYKFGAGTLFLNGSSPSWNGRIVLNVGSLVITNNNALGSATGTTVINSSGGAAVWDGRLILSNNLSVAEPFTLGARQQGSLNSAHIVNGANTNTLAGTITLTTGGSRYNLQSDAGKLITTGTINAAALTGVRELRVAGVADGEIRGAISGGAAGVVFSFIKDGTGQWTLQSTNSVNGLTLVNAGVLALGTNGKLTGSTNITVAAGAFFDVSAVSGGFALAANQTLAGAGTVTGAVSTVAGSVVSPGGAGTAGSLTFANGLKQAAGTTNFFELGNATAPGGVNDLINVAGDLDPNGATIVVGSLNTLVVPGTYRLFNYTGTLLSSFGSVIAADTRYGFALDTSVAGQVSVIVSGSSASLVWSGGTAGTWDVRNAASWNANSAQFYQSDSAAFDDTTASNTVNLTGALLPSSVTVSAAANYIFQGTGKLSGSTGIDKSGSGSLSVSNANDFTGPVNITGGTFVMGNAAALGATNAGTFVSGGGTLDVFNKNLGLEPVTIAGAGVGGAGAVINTAAEQQNSVRLLTLSADAAIGGINRWDVRGAGGSGSFSGLLDLGGNTLTKVSTNKISIVDALVQSPGSLAVDGGTLSFTRSRVEGAGVIDLRTNILQVENFTTGYVSKPLLSSGGRLLVTGNAFTLWSSVTNTGGLTIDNSVGLTLTNEFTGAGSLTKQSAGILTFQRPAAHSGPTAIQGGSVVLGADSGLPNSSSIMVGVGALLDVTALPGGLMLNGQSLGGSGNVAGDVSAGVGSTLLPGSSPGTLTFNNNLSLNNVSATYELGANPFTFGANDLVAVSGGLNLAGVSTIKIVPLAALDTFNPYTIFQYGFLTGGGANLDVTSDSRYSFTLLDPVVTVPYIQVQVSGSGAAATLYWRGNNPANPTLWNTKITTNWLNGATPDTFFLGDAVVFDDSAVGTTVNFVGTLQPSTVTLNNFTKSFAMGGNGSLLAGSLSATGSQPVSIGNAAGNTFISGVTASGGTLRFENTGVNNFGTGLSLSGGNVILANNGGNTLGPVSVTGGLLTVANPGANAFSPLTVSGGDVLIANSVANTFTGIALDFGNLTFDQPFNLAVGAAITGTGNLIKRGANTLTLSGNNSGFSGTIQADTGILRAGAANALGAGSGFAFDGTTVANGATLDVNAINLGNELVTVRGAGVGGLGAIVNNSATGQNNSLHDALLAGDATLGGIGRWDIRTNATGFANLSTGGNPFGLVKVGGNQISIVSAVVDPALGDVDVREGIFSYEVASTGLGDPTRTVTVRSNATWQIWALTNPLDKRFLLKEGAVLRIGSGTGNVLLGNGTLESGNSFINAVSGTQVALTGTLDGNGGFTKPETGTVILSGANSFQGNITNLSGGIIMLSNNLAAGSSGKLIWNDSNTGGSGNTGTRVTLAGGVVIPPTISTSFNATNTGDIRSTFLSQAGSNEWQGAVELRGSGINNAAVDSPNAFVISGPISGAPGYTGTFFVRGTGSGFLPGQLALGGGTFAKTDTGTWTVSSQNNVWALTSLAVGTLRLGAEDAICVSAPFSMGQSDALAAAFDLNGYNQRLTAIRPILGTGTRRIGNDSITADSVLTFDGGTNVSTFGGQLFDNLTAVADPHKLSLRVASGTLNLTGNSSNTGPARVIGGTLGGTGTLVCPLLVDPAGTLAPGLSIGTLTVANNVTLSGTNLMEVSKTGATITNDLLRGVTTLTYGGTLQLALSGAALAAGDALKLYDAASYAGAFAAILPATPGAGLVWDTSELATTGTLKVVASAAPALTGISTLPDGNLSLTLNGVVGQPYTVRASSDVALPMASWTVLTNGLIPTVPFLYTDLLATNYPQRFYRTSSP